MILLRSLPLIILHQRAFQHLITRTAPAEEVPMADVKTTVKGRQIPETEMPTCPPSPVNDTTTEETRAKVIESFIAIENGDHFSLFALTDRETSAVIYSMNWAMMEPQRAAHMGQLVIKSRPFARPRRRPNGTFVMAVTARGGVKDIESKVMYRVPVAKQLTVGDFTKFLMDRNMHDFVFNRFLGCRYWVATVFTELELQKIILKPMKSFQEFAEEILKNETMEGTFRKFVIFPPPQ